MKFADSTLFLGLSVVLHSSELISSQPRPELAEPADLTTLFPGSKGLHLPEIEKLTYAQVKSIPNFTVFYSSGTSLQDKTYLKRGDVIFGYILGNRDTEDGEIEGLSELFPGPYFHVVFSTRTHKWYTLSSVESARLGRGRSLSLVLAHDQAHALYHERNHRTNEVAHDEASEYAYYKAREYEAILRGGSDTKEQRVEKLQDRYHTSYNLAYRLYAGKPSGECGQVQ